MQTTIIAVDEWQRIILTAAIVVGGLLSILYMFQSYGRAYWHARPAMVALAAERSRTVLVLALALVIIVLGLWPEPLIVLSDLASTTLIPRSSP